MEHEEITLHPIIVGSGKSNTDEYRKANLTNGRIIEVQLDRRSKHFTRGEVAGSGDKGHFKVRINRTDEERHCQPLRRDVYVCKTRLRLTPIKER